MVWSFIKEEDLHVEHIGSFSIFAITFDSDIEIECFWYRWKALIEGYNFPVFSFARFLTDFPRRAFLLLGVHFSVAAQQH